MNVSDLPKGDAPVALNFEHFPTRQQAFLWRNWGLVEVKKLAKILQTSSENVVELADDMGLDPAQKVNANWICKGYATLIRRNWHLLPYSQILELLDWSADKLDFMLREDDFLYHKLGSLKPQCSQLQYHPLSENEKIQTELLRKWIGKHFAKAGFEYIQNPFSFYEHLPEAHEFPDQKEQRFSSKIIYAYSAPSGDPLLAEDMDFYSDVVLERLSSDGVNGIWLQAVLYKLYPWDRAGELCQGYQQRIENLQNLVKRAEKYGIGVYLYLNEPRAMPEWFFEKNHDWAKGVSSKIGEQISLCTSQLQTLEYVSEATKYVFENVPQLAGVITISMSENLTHCYAHKQGDKCPRCSKRPVHEVVAELNTVVSQAVHQAAPQAKVIVWTWAWDEKWAYKAIDLLPDNVELMCVSEWGLATNVGGIEGVLNDYSLSQVGPSDMSLKLWQHAQARGMKIHAKVQVNNSWECAAVPYIPVPSLIESHLDKLHQAGVDGILASWTFGGYPGGNLALLENSTKDLANYYGGRSGADKILQAWEKFEDAFREFPFHVAVLYMAPQNVGPANLLFAQNTRYRATMVGFPYDDLESWRSIYPQDIFARQWRLLSQKWKEGLELLQQARNEIPNEKKILFEDINRVAQACYCHFRSTYLQIAFISLRNSKCDSKKLIEILDEEIELAKTLESLALADSRIGFEAANQYAYTTNDLREKVVNCEYLKQKIKGNY